MKNKYIFLLLAIAFISNSCNKDEQSSDLLGINSEATTRAVYIGGTITGEKNPYVGYGYYTYTVNISKQNNPIGIEISATGGGAKFRNPNTNNYEATCGIPIPKGQTQYSFDVLWTKPGNGVALMLRPSDNSVIQLNADLRDINVKMRPFTINAPTTFELGSTITLWCNYPINKNTDIRWTYDKSLFSEISQEASVEQSKFQIKLKSLKSFRSSDIGVEVNDYYNNWFGAKEYFTARKGSYSFQNIGPQITGSTSLTLYDIYTYQFDVSSNLSNIQWEDNEYIRCIGDKNQYSIRVNPIKAGNTEIRVSYNYKNSTERFYSTIPITITSNLPTLPEITGSKSICYGSTQNYSISNLPPQATVQWTTNGGTSPASYNGKIFECKNISPSITTSTLSANITLPSNYSFSINRSVQLFNPAASFNKGYIGDAAITINGSKASTEVYLYNYPYWATNFTWSSTGKVLNIDPQGQSWAIINYDKLGIEYGDIVVTVRYQSPCGDWYELSQMIQK